MVWQKKMIVVIGGMADWGRSIAGAFAEQGATVVLADHARAPLEEAQTAIGGDIYPALTDLRDESHLAQLFEALDQVDVLVCCAAGADAGLDALTPEALADMMETGVYASYWAARHALSKMNAGGCILFVAPGPRAGAQSMVGGAVEALTRALAADVEPRGVRVNCVSLGASAGAEATRDVVDTVQLFAGAAYMTGAVVAVGGGAR